MAAWLMSFNALPANAQRTATASDPTIFIGLWYAGESIPQAMNSACGRLEGREAGSNAGLLVAASLRRITLEGRVGRHYSPDYLCPGLLIDPPDGVHTISTTNLPRGGFATTDARVRIDIVSWFGVAIGGGWAWSKDLPYLTSALSARAGTSIRLGVDLEVTSYRIPWHSRTASFEDGAEIELLAASDYSRWQPGLSLRLVFELPVWSPQPRN